ncbi:MAG TPA: Gfo/Idh/MocA family oxidoreductase [Solirubrobacterales bacterium]|nr:Gfo/Idh/MocA family oxidoreductase [Solirubrobacterales bacterium]
MNFDAGLQGSRNGNGNGRLPDTRRLGFGIVGYGYWGPNLARNIAESQDFRLVGMCELDENRIADFKSKFREIKVDRDFDWMLVDPRIDAVAVATPPSTHYELVKRALLAEKHVLVEKPLAVTSSEAADLIQLSRAVDRVLMPGHTFVYSPAVNKVHELIHDGELGEIYFVTSSRMNLGKYQRAGVVQDLAPHDLSILLHWLGKRITHVTANGRSVFQEGVPETAFLTLNFDGGTQANIQLSWLAPRKLRQMLIIGSERMVQYDDSEADESVKVYDRGLEISQPANFGEYRASYRAGDIVSPRIAPSEPLALELADFAGAIREGSTPASSAEFGLEVVQALEALERSIQLDGQPVEVGSPATAAS